MSADASGLHEFAREMEGAPDLLERDVKAVVLKGSVNIKNEMRAAAQASRHFKGFARAISFDVRTAGAFGGGLIESEIGPTKGAPGSLANIAYFGTSRGGGTVADPRQALDNEAPKFTSALEKLLGNVL